MKWWEPFVDQRGGFGGGGGENNAGTVDVSRNETGTETRNLTEKTTRQVAPISQMELEQQRAAYQQELQRQQFVQQQYQELLNQDITQTPWAIEAARQLNQTFNEQQDARGFQGAASPILNARALGLSNLYAQLAQQNFQNRAGVLPMMGINPNMLGLLGLQQQERGLRAGSTTRQTGSVSRNSQMTGTQPAASGGGQGGLFGSIGGLGGLGSLLMGGGQAYTAFGGGAAAPAALGGAGALGIGTGVATAAPIALAI